MSITLTTPRIWKSNLICRDYRLVFALFPSCSSFFISRCASLTVLCIADWTFLPLSFPSCIVFSNHVLQYNNVRIFIGFLINLNNRKERRTGNFLSMSACCEPALVVRGIPSVVDEMIYRFIHRNAGVNSLTWGLSSRNHVQKDFLPSPNDTHWKR